ncbi:hypothetical protein LZ30DRAFT_7834 [Colletotrichum cereale]|nr:hypothetical protein LZ30DRAFT_7834 [Colletotrichum cereale]
MRRVGLLLLPLYPLCVSGRDGAFPRRKPPGSLRPGVSLGVFRLGWPRRRRDPGRTSAPNVVVPPFVKKESLRNKRPARPDGPPPRENPKVSPPGSRRNTALKAFNPGGKAAPSRTVLALFYFPPFPCLPPPARFVVSPQPATVA